MNSRPNYHCLFSWIYALTLHSEIGLKSVVHENGRKLSHMGLILNIWQRTIISPWNELLPAGCHMFCKIIFLVLGHFILNGLRSFFSLEFWNSEHKLQHLQQNLNHLHYLIKLQAHIYLKPTKIFPENIKTLSCSFITSRLSRRNPKL